MTVDIDWDNLKFEFTKTDSIFIAHSNNEGKWEDGNIIPFSTIELSPAAAVLNYGQGIFEGMKAQHTVDGAVVLFRPIDNGKRMAKGAERLCMPPFPAERFVDAVKETVKNNIDYVPPRGRGSLYIRPALWGTGPVLGISPAETYTFCIFTSPVGPYFKDGVTPIKLEITKEFHRSAPRGTGGIKAIGNYAAAMYPAKQSKAKGFSEVIYLNASNDRYIEEVGSSNFFCLLNGELHTPKLAGSILPGITRDSVITIAKDKLNLVVHERDIDYEEIFNAEEIFCTGTATVICPIGSVSCEGKDFTINNFNVGPVTKKLYDLLTGIQTKKEEDPYGWIVEVE